MSLGLVGRKVGMTRIFAEDGTSIPVTVLEVANNRVTQIKTEATDGYSAVQVAYGTRRASRVTKAAAGHFAKAGVEAGSVLKEFPLTAEQAAGLQVGGTVAIETFQVGQLVDVTGTSHGKGFAGSARAKDRHIGVLIDRRIEDVHDNKGTVVLVDTQQDTVTTKAGSQGRTPASPAAWKPTVQKWSVLPLRCQSTLWSWRCTVLGSPSARSSWLRSAMCAALNESSLWLPLQVLIPCPISPVTRT